MTDERDELAEIGRLVLGKTAPEAAKAILAAGYRKANREEPNEMVLLLQAIEQVVTRQFASTSLLQQKLGVGFARAKQLLDIMQSIGLIGPPDGAKAREVLVKPDNLVTVLWEGGE